MSVTPAYHVRQLPGGRSIPCPAMFRGGGWFDRWRKKVAGSYKEYTGITVVTQGRKRKTTRFSRSPRSRLPQNDAGTGAKICKGAKSPFYSPFLKGEGMWFPASAGMTIKYIILIVASPCFHRQYGVFSGRNGTKKHFSV